MQQLSQQELEAIMRKADKAAAEGRLAAAYDLWATAAHQNVPEAYINITRLLAQSALAAPDIETKCDYCKNIAQLLDEETVKKFGLGIMPFEAAIVFESVAGFMADNNAPTDNVDNYYNIAARYYYLAVEISLQKNWTVAAQASNGLGRLISDGKGVEQNKPLAYGYFIQAVRIDNHGEAMFNIAMMHYRKEIDLQLADEERMIRALQWFKKSIGHLPQDQMHAAKREAAEQRILELEKVLETVPAPILNLRPSFPTAKP